jgi:hypothetical protein
LSGSVANEHKNPLLRSYDKALDIIEVRDLLCAPVAGQQNIPIAQEGVAERLGLARLCGCRIDGPEHKQ